MISVLSFPSILNLSHLFFLRDTFRLGDETVKAYWIYAERKGGDYVRVGAKGEGVTCVDDVARIAIFLLEMHEKFGGYEREAREALDFLLKMQDSDGDFYNFLERDGEINRDGPTSRKSGNWWAVRAMWALAKGARILKDEEYLKHAEMVVPVIRKYIKGGLLHRSSSISSVAVLGLLELYEITKKTEYLNLAEDLGEAILNLRVKRGPFKGFISDSPDKFIWHGWGSRYLEAFSKLYEVTRKSEFLEAAKEYADVVGKYFMVLGPIYSIDGRINLYPQLSYALECMVSGLVELYRVTREGRYELLAAVLASFLFGNNRLRVRMLGENGEGFDGLHSTFVNRNAGAESTVCALRTVLKVMGLEHSYLLDSKRIASWGIETLEAEGLDTGISDFEFNPSNGGILITDSPLRLRGKISISTDDTLRFYVAVGGNGKVVYRLYIGGYKFKGSFNPPHEKGFVALGDRVEVGEGEEKFVIYLKPEKKMEVDQILVRGEKPFVIFESSGKIYEFDGEVLREKGKVKIEIQTGVQEFHVGLLRIGRFLAMELKGIYNNDGIAYEREAANFDNPDGTIGARYPAEEIEKNLKDEFFIFNGIPFVLTIKGKDNIACNGQKIVLERPILVHKIYILGSSDHGDYSGDIVLGTGRGEEKTRISFSDWCGEPVFGERIVMEIPYRYISSGERQYVKPKIYLQILKVEREINYMILPDLPTMHIFSITLETDESR